MHAQAVDAKEINALANISGGLYAARVSMSQGPDISDCGPLDVSPADRTHAVPDPVVMAWRDIAACHAAVCAALERELGERHGLGVSDFEVLARLAEAKAGAEDEFRAQDLAEAVHLSQSALSRLVDRLARHGLVDRCVCDFDRRGVYVRLTEAGRQRYAEAAPTHRDVLQRTLPVSLLTALQLT
jgi:DNA-binding MarR family transcriptional regulator